MVRWIETYVLRLILGVFDLPPIDVRGREDGIIPVDYDNPSVVHASTNIVADHVGGGDTCWRLRYLLRPPLFRNCESPLVSLVLMLLQL
jgi:hypothetical protein